MSAPPDSDKNPSGQSLDRILLYELTTIRKKRIGLELRKRPGVLHYSILSSCIFVNFIFVITLTDYPALFIAASFYLNMFYFISLLIPTNFSRTGLSRDEIIRFPAWLRDVGIKSGTSRFSRLFINSFFMNSWALSPGIGLLFTVDIFFSLFSYAFMNLPRITTIIVISQCIIIILFYLAAWKIEPSSSEFERNVERVRKRLSREYIPPWIVSAIIMTGVLFAAFIFLTAIILLPGMTVTAFMSQSGLNELGYLILFITILAVSQYFLIRHIHGISSREMAARILDFQEDSIGDLIRMHTGGWSGTYDDHKDRMRRVAVLLESRIYTIKEHTLGGLFPVYTVDIDFSALMDTVTLSAITGIAGRKEAEDQVTG
jgi:hypothetical protein